MSTVSRENQIKETTPKRQTEARADENVPLSARRPVGVVQRTLASQRIRPVDVMVLQRLVGNRAIQVLLAKRDDEYRARDANGVASDAETAVRRAESSIGVPLPDSVRRQFELSVGADLSGVRIHTGAESADAADAVGAKAFTIGQNVHLGTAQYAPTNPTGLHLLAHEVAHTIQQRGVEPNPQGKLDVSSPDDAAEVEADDAADAMVSGGSFRLGGFVPAIHRQETPEQTIPGTTPTSETAPPSATPQVPGTNQQPGAVSGTDASRDLGGTAASPTKQPEGGTRIPIPEAEFEFKVPVVKTDLGYITGEGDVTYKVTYKLAESSDEGTALKIKNGQLEVEKEIKKKYGSSLNLSGGGSVSATEGSVGVGLEIPGAKTNISFKVVKVDAKKAELQFGVLEWKQTYPLASSIAMVYGAKIECHGNAVVSVQFSPNKEKIALELAKRYGTTLTSEIAFDLAIDTGILMAGILTVAGTINELSKAADLGQLLDQVIGAHNMFTSGVQSALRGDPSPGSGWYVAGWNAGKKAFDDAITRAKSSHPDWSDLDIRTKVINSAGHLESSAPVQTAIRRQVGQGFWNRWVAANHGLGTFLGDAMTACGMCFGKVVYENDPDLAAWKAASSLPEFMK